MLLWPEQRSDVQRLCLCQTRVQRGLRFVSVPLGPRAALSEAGVGCDVSDPQASPSLSLSCFHVSPLS